MDMLDTKILFENKFDKQMLKVDLPTIKYWKIRADQHVDFTLLPQNSVVVLEFRDFDIKFNCEFERTDAGYLKPVFYTMDLNWGETSFFHEDKFLSLVFFQVIKFMQVIIKNSIYFLGDYIFSGMAEPTLTTIMNNYQLPLHLKEAFKGQTGQDDFVIDFRQTMTPFIGEGFIDLMASGELFYNGEGCGEGSIQNNNLHFLNSQDYS
jgi:hypothetical protein